MDLAELNEHCYSLPGQPTAILYLTSYSLERCGFCLTHQQRQSLKPGQYRAVIRSQLKAGNLTYGHCVLPSTTGSLDEILISTYLCHPSMANNKLFVPLVAAFLYESVKKLPTQKINYRFVFVPETIGAIT